MKSQLLLVGATALVLGGLIGPRLASAYRGDPNVQGPNYSPEHHALVTSALESGDYQAWVTAMEGRGPSRRITADNFARFQEMHRLQLAGDTEGAARIRTELGLGLRNGSGAGQGRQYGRQ